MGTRLLLMYIAVILTCVCVLEFGESKEKHEYFTLPESYDRRYPPNRSFVGRKDNSLTISVAVQIRDILRIKEAENEVVMDINIEYSWEEDRVELAELLEEGEFCVLDKSDGEKFWTPDLYIRGMREFNTNRGDVDLVHYKLFADKTFMMVHRAYLSIKCDFDFFLYPLDVQTCILDFTSVRYPHTTLRFVWKESDGIPEAYFVMMTKLTKKMNQMKLFQYTVTVYACPNTFNTDRGWANCSTLRVYLKFNRHIQDHFLETYVPTGLFVIMSWGSFLVKPDAVPGRMVLLVTNLLSLVTLFEAERSSSPPSTGVTCIDVWILSCIVFVFVASVEYGVILYKIRETVSPSKGDSLKPIPLNLCESAVPVSFRSCRILRNKIRKIKHKILFYTHVLLSTKPDSSWETLDKLSLAAFPLLFLVYTGLYWCIYLAMKYDDISDLDCPPSFME